MDVVIILITLFLLLVMEPWVDKITSSLKTPGVMVGVTKAMSELDHMPAV